MFFTQDDYIKIQQWLSKNSVKDTEFNEANIPFNGNEIVSIVQGNQNKKVFLKDLVSQIFNLGVSDFINITDKYEASYITLEEAIRYIPSKARKVGQVITFLNKEGHWHIYQFRGVLNQWNTLDKWEDLFDWEKLVNNSILPDEEDLTKSLPDKYGNSYLSLKDRKYNPEDFSGLGRVILRKNIVEVEDLIYGKGKKNILIQGMINEPNTIYEIRYDFDLNSAEITIPEGCVLDFQGGSFSNGTLIHNKTKYIGNIKYENIILYGKCYNESNQELTLYKFDVINNKPIFCASAENVDDLTRLIQNAYRCGINNTIPIIRGKYDSVSNNIVGSQDLDKLFSWFKHYNISIEGIKFHIDESANFNSAPYNQTDYVNKYFTFIKNVISKANTYITYKKVWVINEHDTILLINDIYNIWGNALNDFKEYCQSQNKEMWISVAGIYNVYRNNNHFNYNISANYYPAISKFKKDLSYNKQVVNSIVDELNCFFNRIKNKEYILSECGVKPIEGALISPANYSIQGTYDYDIFDIFYGIIRKVLDNSQISTFCIWYIERMDEDKARTIVYNHLIK